MLAIVGAVLLALGLSLATIGLYGMLRKPAIRTAGRGRRGVPRRASR